MIITLLQWRAFNNLFKNKKKFIYCLFETKCFYRALCNNGKSKNFNKRTINISIKKVDSILNNSFKLQILIILMHLFELHNLIL